MVCKPKRKNRRRWFKPQKQTGWSKKQSPETRRRKLLASTPKNMNIHGRYLQAARRANALANVTKNPATKRAARADANYFYDKLK